MATRQPTPRVWTDDQLAEEGLKSIQNFRETRVQEPLEQYLEAFDRFKGHVEDLLEETIDLSNIAELAARLASDKAMLEVLRYLASPPISVDDLKVLAETPSLSAKAIKQDPDIATRVVAQVMVALDRNRFPWVGDDREPEEQERELAATSTAALMGVRRVMTDRANSASRVLPTTSAGEDHRTVLARAHRPASPFSTRTAERLLGSSAPGEAARGKPHQPVPSCYRANGISITRSSTFSSCPARRRRTGRGTRRRSSRAHAAPPGRRGLDPHPASARRRLARS